MADKDSTSTEKPTNKVEMQIMTPNENFYVKIESYDESTRDVCNRAQQILHDNYEKTVDRLRGKRGYL